MTEQTDTIENDPHGVYQPPERTEEQIDRGLTALVQAPRDYSGAGLNRPTTSASPIRYAAHRLTPDAEPPWDCDERLRPTEYAAARAKLVAVAAHANELADRLADLPAQKAQAQAAFQHEAIAADRAGRKPRLPAAHDWDRDEAVLQAQMRGRREAFDQARAAYRKAVQETREEWLAILLEQREPLRAAAVDALAHKTVGEALAAIERLRGLLNATVTVWQSLHPKKSLPPLDSRVLSDFSRVASAARDLLISDADVVTGAWMSETLEPPRHVRKQWFESGGSAIEALLSIELGENYEFTDHTKPYAVATGRWGKYVTTPSGQRFLAS